jgi:hypothetical protein
MATAVVPKRKNLTFSKLAQERILNLALQVIEAGSCRFISAPSDVTAMFL